MVNQRRRRKQRQRAARSANEFAQRSREAYWNDGLEYQKNKKAQFEYLKRIAEIEKDILSHTVFFFHVLDLGRDANLQKLRSFLERNYGRVEQCISFSEGKKRLTFPGARVRFECKADAEKFFGRDLFTISNFVEVPCPVGYRSGMIRLKPCRPDDGMAKDALEGSVIKLTATNITLGHWFPAGQDICTRLEIKTEREDLAEWLEEVKTEASCTVTIDLSKRVVELGALSQPGCKGTAAKRYYVTFRFKELVNTIDIGVDSRNSDEYSLLFSLKHPPKLESQKVSDTGTIRERSVKFLDTLLVNVFRSSSPSQTPRWTSYS
jgi:hypothetical protein